MLTNWTPIVRPPIDGEVVDQKTIGRSLVALQQRTEFLYERLNDFSAQNGKLVIQNAKLGDSVSVGDWVYYNSSSSRYEKAIAEGELDPMYNSYRATARTFVVGLCVSVEFTGDLGSILMSGWINDIVALGIPSVSQLLEDPSVGFSPGRYYLSRKNPGKMTNLGGAPLVQLGFFSEKECFVAPLQKDIFESHTHYKFSLASRPAASQNTLGTGWVSHTDSNSKTHKYVDYFYSSNSAYSTDVAMCIKGNGTTNTYGDEFRIDIYKDSNNKMVRRIVYGAALEFNLPESTTSTMSVLPAVDYPLYGQWVDIDGTGMSISFIKKGAMSSGSYTTTLVNDLSLLPAGPLHKFCVYLPQDTIGWTNVNQFDGLYTSSSIYRYLREYDIPLNAVWPPVPTESVSITNNGIGLVALQDFICFPQDLMWNIGLYNSLKTYSPWAHDYSARGTYTPDQQYEKNLELFFSKANISTARPIVLTLQSATPAIQVFDCFTGDPSNSGNLSLDLRLDLNLLNGPNSKKCISSIDPVSQKFVSSGLVSKLTAGNGIKITETGSSGALQGNYGELTIENDSTENSGEVSIVSLKNAKESLFNGVTPCVLFLPPSNAKCEIVSKIKIPKQTLPAGAVPKLSISGLVFGSENTSVNKTAVFKSTHFVLRKSSNISYFDDKDGNNNAFAVQYWRVEFNGNVANVVHMDEYPNPSSLLLFETFNGSEIIQQPLTSMELTTGTINQEPGQYIQPEDTILTIIKRISSSSSIVDDYDGEVGFTGINWTFNV
jgi:hypothetical protein